MPRTFHNLSAGSTTILPNGKVVRFGGKIEKVEGGTKVGIGTLTTDDAEEISWLEQLCKLPTPQVWEEKTVDDVAVPGKVAAGMPADSTKAAGDNADNAARANDPKVVDAQANMGKVIAASGAAK